VGNHAHRLNQKSKIELKKSIMKQMYTFLYYRLKQTINRIMNLREKVNALFAKHNVSLSAEEVVEVKQMVEAILEDGTSIYSDSDTWAAGVRVFGKDAEGNEVAVADGEYKTAEGITVVVADGLLVELKPMEEEEPEVKVEVEETEQAKEESLSAEVEGLLSLVAKLESELADIKKANAELSSEVTKLSAQPAASSIKEVKQAKQTPSKPYAKMSAEERFVFHLNK
jgi:DNA repair exonuclease SbcCD ATPase subunit